MFLLLLLTRTIFLTVFVAIALTIPLPSLSYRTISRPLCTRFLPSVKGLAIPFRAPSPFALPRLNLSSAVGMLTTSTPRILSIQSHTVHGFVGNKAVTFPLQTMGFDVNAINTITLSNHPAYSRGTKGQSLDEDVLKSILAGLEDNNLLNYDVIMTGYTRAAAHLEQTADAIARIRRVNPNAIYVCDPVLGDNEQYYVPTELLIKYQELLLPLSTVITPNLFESQVLSGVTIRNQEDAIRAAKVLHSLGPSIVVMTGLPFVSQKGDEAPRLSVLLSYLPSPSSEPIIFRIDVPKLEGYYAGCGDLFSAFMTSAVAHMQKLYPRNPYLLGTALEYAAQTMAEVLVLTKEKGSRELCIVESRDVFIRLQGKLRELSSANRSSPPSLHPIGTTPSTSETQFLPNHRSILVNHPKVLGIIFDMDGTLTEPGAIDFQAMYDRIGLQRTKDSDILSLVNRLPLESDRQRAMEIIYEEEMAGIERQVLRDNLHSIIHRLYDTKLRLALCTRNCEKAYLQFLSQSKIHEHFFLPALFRESTSPVMQKPNPALAKMILSSWGVGESDDGSDHRKYWFVGDSIDDMKCGKLAGLTTVLVYTEHGKDLPQRYPELIDHVVHSLDELFPLLDIPFNL